MKKTKSVFDIVEDDEDAISSFRSKKKPKTPRSNRIQLTDTDMAPSIAPEVIPDRIAYIYSKESAEITSKLPTNEGRVPPFIIISNHSVSSSSQFNSSLQLI